MQPLTNFLRWFRRVERRPVSRRDFEDALGKVLMAPRGKNRSENRTLVSGTKTRCIAKILRPGSAPSYHKVLKCGAYFAAQIPFGSERIRALVNSIYRFRKNTRIYLSKCEIKFAT